MLNAVSVCAGIEAATEACEGLDFRFLLYSEIAKFPRSVLRERHRAVDQRRYNSAHAAEGRPVLWGDFSALRPRHLRRFHGHANVDVLFGGTPCQSYSVAGKRGGLDDPRGELSLEYALLAYRLGVLWFLWENVPGVLSSSEGKDFAAILSAFTGREVPVPHGGWCESGWIPEAGPGQYGVAWRVFDAQFAGVPQRRRRIFVVGHLGDHRRSAAVLFDRYSLQWHPAPRREPGERVAGTVSARASGGGGLGTDFECSGGLVPCSIQAGALRQTLTSGPDGVGVQEHVAYTLEARSEVQACAYPILFDPAQITSRANRSNPKFGDPCHTVSAAAGAPMMAFAPDGGPTMAVRRLTPEECELLQGFPVGYTAVTHRGKPAADGPRYKALGNSWAVPCARWIVERIQYVHALPSV